MTVLSAFRATSTRAAQQRRRRLLVDGLAR
jgi:hypothetical protein